MSKVGLIRLPEARGVSGFGGFDTLAMCLTHFRVAREVGGEFDPLSRASTRWGGLLHLPVDTGGSHRRYRLRMGVTCCRAQSIVV